MLMLVGWQPQLMSTHVMLVIQTRVNRSELCNNRKRNFINKLNMWGNSK